MTGAYRPVWGAVVVAAGRGERFGDQDKLLVTLEGRPVIAWSVEALNVVGRFQELVVVTGSANDAALRAALLRHCPNVAITFSPGGSTRSASVRSGLAALTAGVTHVAVHDAARPLVTPTLIHDVLDSAEQSGAAVPGIPPVATIALLDDAGKHIAGPVDRTKLLELQTPQAAGRAALVDALARYPDETDESTALYKAGHDVALVPGERTNLKLTTPDDLTLLRALTGRRVTLS